MVFPLFPALIYCSVYLPLCLTRLPGSLDNDDLLAQLTWTSTLQVGVCVSFNTSFLLLQGSYHVYQPLKYLQIQRRGYFKVWRPPGLLMVESCNRLVEASGDERTKTPDRGLGGKEV